MPTIDEALERAKAAIRAQGHAPPGETADEARKRAAARVKAQKRLIDTSANVVKRLTGMDDSNGNADKSAALKEQGARPVRWKYVEDIISLISVPVNKNFQRHTDRITALEQRIAELEARPTMKYEGVWETEKTYSVGDFVTHSGALWHCEDTNISVRPGSGSAVWKLAVKRGRADP